MQQSRNSWAGGLALCLAIAGTAALASDDAYATPPFLLLKLDGAYVKWGEPVLGKGATVRYAFVASNTQFSDVRNCEAMTSLDGPLQKFGIQPEQLRAEAAAAFRLWETAADIRFHAVDDPAKADILIGGQLLPRGRAFANVAYADANGGATRRLKQSLICINQNQPWKIGFGGDPKAYDLRYTIAHEIGHAIGLNHPGPSGQLMGFKYSEGFRTLQPGDMEGAVALYGSREGTATAAAPEGTPKESGELGLR